MENVTTLRETRNSGIHINWHRLLPWVIPVVLIILWQVAVTAGWLDSQLIPSPLSVLEDGVTLWQTGELEKNVSISLFRATVGFAIGGSLGFVLGLMNGLSKVARGLTDTTIQMFRNIPHLSLIPLVIILLGIGESAKISLVCVGVLFPIYINTYSGIRGIDPELMEMGRAYGLNRRQLFSKIVFPGALPTILVGVRYALGVMWTTLIVAETISSNSGIGYMASNAQEFMDMDTVLLCIVIYALLGKLSDIIAKTLESLCLEWQEKGGAKQ